MAEQFSVEQIRTENYKVYYRVFADGVEQPSLVYIFASQQSAKTMDELKEWCRDNASRLGSGRVIHASNLREKREGRGA